MAYTLCRQESSSSCALLSARSEYGSPVWLPRTATPAERSDTMMRTPAGQQRVRHGCGISQRSRALRSAKHVRVPALDAGRLFSFPIHGMDEAMGLGTSCERMGLVRRVTGLLTAAVVEFGPSSIPTSSMCTVSRGIFHSAGVLSDHVLN